MRRLFLAIFILIFLGSCSRAKSVYMQLLPAEEGLQRTFLHLKQVILPDTVNVVASCENGTMVEEQSNLRTSKPASVYLVFNRAKNAVGLRITEYGVTKFSDEINTYIAKLRKDVANEFGADRIRFGTEDEEQSVEAALLGSISEYTRYSCLWNQKVAKSASNSALHTDAAGASELSRYVLRT